MRCVAGASRNSVCAPDIAHESMITCLSAFPLDWGWADDEDGGGELIIITRGRRKMCECVFKNWEFIGIYCTSISS